MLEPHLSIASFIYISGSDTAAGLALNSGDCIHVVKNVVSAIAENRAPVSIKASEHSPTITTPVVDENRAIKSPAPVSAEPTHPPNVKNPTAKIDKFKILLQHLRFLL